MKTITANTSQNNIPRWAHLERKLIDTMNATIEPIVQKHLRPDGRFLWPYDEENFQNIDGLDDAYESFHSWPLFYLVGGDDKFLAVSHREFDIVTEQFSGYGTGHGHPMWAQWDRHIATLPVGLGHMSIGTSIEITLVNTGIIKTRELVIQAGTYGEHKFAEVRYSQPGWEETKMMINGVHFRLVMLPGSIVEFQAGIERFCNTPSYSHPWS